MRKIINGRLYDTEKAKEIATYHYNSGDFARYNEKLYKTKNNILQQIDLTSIAHTAEITPYYAWENVERPMIIEFRNRAINKIDGTKVPCAMISGAEPLIELADKQFFRINWEQEGGELKVFADNDLFQPIHNCIDKECLY